jgi:CrcB protein
VSPLLLVAVGLIGGLGALGRFALDGAVARRFAGSFPLGTFAVNVVGAFLLGVVAGAVASEDASRLLATGALGAFTTFSTWMLESHRLAEEGRGGIGAGNFAISLAAGILVVWLGRELGMAL